ncbi:double-stranded DNA repair protein Mre11 [Thermococcus sp. P6]|uniref:DNA double-strand break repair protein Mre11 n=1 Tax=Thermococcus sp. P6 TaxID=122420 RepID=UPI000B59E6F9|nr:DNA double-strand break repair protein Mre11 [Thermococcus sp. P6]ASJ10485.1 double-stranded DNA repair protein Mre11 [Thermococcus sp. P6]
MKFAHIADVHLGFEQYRLPYRAREFARSFEEAVDRSIEEGVDFILIVGDLFHSSRPSPGTIQEALEVLEKPKKAGIPVFAIEGNHDRTQRKVSAYNLLERLGLLHLIGLRDERVENDFLTSERLGSKYLVRGTVETGRRSVEIHGIKYMSAAWFEKNKLTEIFKPEGDAILMLHQGIKELVEKMAGIIPDSQRDYFELRMKDLPKGYRYYALGHIHREFVTSYDIGTLVYPGSLQRWDFGDYEVRYRWNGRSFIPEAGTRKGFYIVEDFKPRFVELKVRPFVDIKLKADEETAIRELQRLREKIPREAFVRLDISWEKPYDVSGFRRILEVEHLYVRARFEGKKGVPGSGGLPEPGKYFTPVELKTIRLAGEKDFNEVDAVIELFLKGEEETEPTLTDEKSAIKVEPVERVKPEGPKPKKPSNILAWIGGGDED